MKQRFIIIAACLAIMCFASSAYAQDIIVTNDAQKIEAKIIEVSKTAIKYKELNPDLVTLDITMPVLDGIQALSLIRKHDPEAKAVMITAAGQRDKMIKAVKYGAAEFITKPYEKEVVEKILKEVLDI